MRSSRQTGHRRSRFAISCQQAAHAQCAHRVGVGPFTGPSQAEGFSRHTGQLSALGDKQRCQMAGCSLRHRSVMSGRLSVLLRPRRKISQSSIDSKGWLLLRRACAKASLDLWSTASNKLRKKSRTKLLLEDIVSAGRCATLIA